MVVRGITTHNLLLGLGVYSFRNGTQKLLMELPVVILQQINLKQTKKANHSDKKKHEATNVR